MSPSLRANLFLLSFLGGITAASLRAFSPPTLFYYLFLIIGLLVVLIIPRQSIIFSFLLILGAFGAGLLHTSFWRNRHFTSYSYGNSYHFKALITEPADIRSQALYLVVEPLENLDHTGHQPLSRSPLRIKAPRYPLLQYGDQVEITGIVEQPEPFQDFNYPLYLERFGIHGEISRPQKIQVIAHNRGSPFLAWLYRLRQSSEQAIQATLPEPESSFLGGILLGSKRAIPSEIQAALQNTGTIHIIVMSGSNITILLEIILYFLPFTKRQQQFTAVILISLFVSLLSGAPASVLRGATVACISRFITLYSRRPWPTPFLLCSITLPLLGNPLLLVADPGFQISFAAFIGLVYLSTPIREIVDRSRFTAHFPEIIRDSLSQSLAASLGISGLSFKFFGQLSFLGLLVNPFALWILHPITLLGLCLVFLQKLSFLRLLLRLPLWLLLHFTLTIISWVGHWPIGILHLQISWQTAILLYCFLGFLIYLLFYHKKRVCPNLSHL